jgi:hypothetical protein
MKVRKALTPEQKTTLANAKALIAEIEGMEAGEGQEDTELKEAMMALNEKDQMGEQPEGEDIEKEEEDDEEEVEPGKAQNPMKVVKDTTTIGKPDASTGSSDAEEKVEDQPEQSKENLDEIAKSLARLVKAMGRRTVTKSKDNTLNSVLIGLSKVVKSMQEDQVQQRAVLNDIMDGLGLAKTVEQNYQTSVQKSRRPVQTADTNEVLREVAKGLNALIGRQAEDKTASLEGNSGTVRKALSENLESLLTYKP